MNGKLYRTDPYNFAVSNLYHAQIIRLNFYPISFAVFCNWAGKTNARR